MTSYAPTPADFMRMTDGPDFDADPSGFKPGPHDWVVPPSPSSGPASVDLTEVLERLDRITKLIERPLELEAQVGELSQENAGLADTVLTLDQRIADALEAIKKSTSKVANQVREILQPEPLAQAPVSQAAAEAGQGKPLSKDNPLPEARQCPGCERYFDEQGFAQHLQRECAADPEEGKGARIVRATPAAEVVMKTAPPEPDADVSEWRAYAEQQGLAGVEHLNRSQIRTMLGVAHPSENGEG